MIKILFQKRSEKFPGKKQQQQQKQRRIARTKSCISETDDVIEGVTKAVASMLPTKA